MKIYLAVEVFEDTSWWDAHHMLGAYLTPEAGLAAFQAQHPDESLDLGWDDMAVVADCDEDPWRWLIPVDLELPESLTAAMRTLILAGIDAPH
jgi:hypothetical protein